MKNRSRENISRMLIQKALGRLSAEDAVALDKLIAGNAGVQEEWQSTLQLMEQWGELPDEDIAWAQMDKKISSIPVDNTRSSRLIYKISAAAIIVIAIGLSAYFVIPGLRPAKAVAHAAYRKATDNGLLLTLANGAIIDLEKEHGSVAQNGVKLDNDSAARTLTYNTALATDNELNTLHIPAGMDYTINLSDGTQVLLNSATTLKFPFRFSGNTREITLDGEAYLKVAHDASRPFIVHLPTGDVRVLGTEFNVNTYTPVEKVSLVKGCVRFTGSADSIEIRAGQAAVMSGKAFKALDIDPDDLAWIDGKYILDNTSVEDIARLIPRWFGVQVVIDDKDVAARRFNGVIYKNKPLSGFLELLQGTTDAGYYYADSVLHLK